MTAPHGPQAAQTHTCTMTMALRCSQMQAKRAAQPLQPCGSLPETPPGPQIFDAGGMTQASLQKPVSLSSPDVELVQPEEASPTCGDSNSFKMTAADNSHPGHPPGGSSTEVGIASSECIICWEAAPNVLLQPCGHICACSGCAALLEHSDCPMCRCKVECSMVLQL